MKKLFRMAALVTTLLVMSVPAWADSYVDHVSMAPNGKGDVLIYPVYMAFDGFQTKLQVINTSRNVSAIAKVVFRSAQWSQETLDFFIFLTPTDVWEGYLQWDGTQVVLYSEDDSILVNTTPTFASPDNPVKQPLQVICNDINLWGYAEVFLTYVFDANYTRRIDGVDREINLTRPPVAKADLYGAFVGTGNLISPVPRAGFIPDDGAGSYNLLAGNLQMQSPLLNWTSALNAVTLKDYRIAELVNVLEETVLGAEANNNILEVEAVLAKNDIGMPYINNAEGNTLHFLTFPTKLTELDDECRIVDWGSPYVGFVGHNQANTAPFNYESVRVTYTSNIYDQKENTRVGPSPIFSPAPVVTNRFLDEVNFLVPGVFDKGWVRYGLPDGPTAGMNLAQERLGYSGAPVIPVVVNFGQGFSTMYGFYTDGTVFGRDADTDPWTPLPGYTYLRATPFTPPEVE